MTARPPAAAGRARWALAVAIMVWTLIAWGGRIGLLAGGEGPWALARIAGSLLIGSGAAAVLAWAPRARWGRAVLVLFSVWSVGLWSRSLAVNWAGDGSLAFKIVHTTLATGFFTLAVLAWRMNGSGRDRQSRPACLGS